MFKNKKTLTFTKKAGGTPIPNAKFDDAGGEGVPAKIVKKPGKKMNSKQLANKAALALFAKK